MVARSSFSFSLAVLASFLPSALAAQGARFGRAVAVADVDGDGFDDVIVGEPDHDGGLHREGRVLVFRGSASGPAAAPSWSQRGLQAGAHFGASVAGLGDMNGDGFEDVAIGAPGYDLRLRHASLGGSGQRPLRAAGLVTVFLGSPAGLASQPVLFRPGIQGGERLGAALAGAGDVNGDGYDDLLVGGTGTNNRRGVALLFAGSPSGPGPLPVWIEHGSVVDGGFGSVLGGGGDVNGDGFDDIVIGAPDDGPLGYGVGFLYRGSAAGLPAEPNWSVSPEAGDDGADNFISDWGQSLCIAGDLNGDGFDDIVIGNPTFDANLGHGSGVSPDSGAIFVYSGSAGAPPAFERRRSGIGGGPSAPAGDLDSDGHDDVVIPSTLGSVFEGVRELRYGHTTSFLGPDAVVQGDAFAAGDVDGDGFDDLVAGWPGHDVPHAEAGIVYVHRGSAGLIGAADWELVSP